MGVSTFLSNQYVLGLAGFAVGAVCGYYVRKKLMETKVTTTTKNTWRTSLSTADWLFQIQSVTESEESQNAVRAAANNYMGDSQKT